VIRWIIALVLIAGPALASELDETKAQLQTTEAELKAVETETKAQPAVSQQVKEEEQRLSATADLLRGSSARHKQEGDQWDTDNAAMKVKDADYKTRWADLNARIVAHNQSCPGGTVPKDVYERCHPQYQALQGPTQARNAERAPLDAERQRLRDRATTWNQMNTGLKARWKDLSDATLANAAKQKAMNARMDDLNQKASELNLTRTRLIAQIRQLTDDCRGLRENSPSLEALKLKCGNVQFDNANPNLPPLGAQPKIGTTITPNR
jgi:chromosome segregation ATPase